MKFLSVAFSKEPVAIVNAIRLCALAAMTFGLHLTDIQLTASMLALEALLTLFTRAQVTSSDSLQKLTPGTLAAAQAADSPAKGAALVASVLLVCGLSLGAGTVAGCAPKAYTTEAGRASFTANEVVLRLGEFQRAVISAEKANKVKTADARAIVIWISGDSSTTPPTLGAVDILNTYPQGWKTTVLVSWVVVQPHVLASPTLAPWVPLIDGVLQGVQ